jgi:hypothetical protein
MSIAAENLPLPHHGDKKEKLTRLGGYLKNCRRHHGHL